MLNRLFLDFNAYFASVEQQLRPELRSRPVGVVPVQAESSCCIAASYEAKARGVKTGTGVREARSLCPGLILVQARPSVYVEMHHRLVALVEACMHVEEVFSIDEMVCPLTGHWRDREKAKELAGLMKRRLARSYPAIMCSIGLAPNTWLAKTASDMQKPDGLTVLDEDNLPGALFDLELDDLCGIGKNMLRRLHAHGIQTVEQLYRSSVQHLRQVWGGIEGERMFARLRGEEVWCPAEGTQSIGHSHVLPPELRSQERALAVMHKLLQKAAVRLRAGDWFAGRLDVRVKYFDNLRWKDGLKIFETRDTTELARALNTLHARRPWPDARPLAVAVTLSNLVAARNHTPSLFEQTNVGHHSNAAAAPDVSEDKLSASSTETTTNSPKVAAVSGMAPAGSVPGVGAPPRREMLHAAMDALNRRYGSGTLYYANATDALRAKAAPMRISFTHIPDLEREDDHLE